MEGVVMKWEESEQWQEQSCCNGDIRAHRR